MRYLIIIALSCLLVCCEKGIGDRLPIGDERIVIQGWVTDILGPQRVSISTTAPINTNVATPKVSGASVVIFNDSGIAYELTEVAPGSYESLVGFAGTIGRRYELQVTLADGTSYQSFGEVMEPVSKLESITCTPAEGLDGTSGFEILAELVDPLGVDNQYRWITFINDTLQNKPVEMRIGSDDFADGDRLQINLGFYQVKAQDTLRVEQRSLSPEALDYLILLLTQSLGLANSFSPAPAFVPGNINNPNDPQEVVLGYFGASAVSSLETIK